MRKSFCFLFFLCVLCYQTQAQDTLILKYEKIACKVMRIAEKVVEYKKWDNIDGPTYEMSKEKIVRIVFQNGTTENFGKSSASTHTSTESFITRRQGIKVDLLAPSLHKITLGYEYTLNKDIGFEGYLSFISSQVLDNRRTYYTRAPRVDGVGLKLGTKFWLNHDPSMNKGNPHGNMGGWFMRIDLMYTRAAMANVRYYEYNAYPYYYDINRYIGTVNIDQFGMAINFGWQVLLSNRFTVQMNGGVGYLYTGTVFKPGFIPPSNENYGAFSEGNSFNPYGNGLIIDNTTLCVSGNLTFGYVLGGKKSKQQK